MTENEMVRLVKPYARGQITIPAEFRERLGIDENTILQLRLIGRRIEISPLRVVNESQLLREYDGGEIESFLEEDKLDDETAAKVRKLLGG